ncbi:ATP-dependent helicase [Aeromicrobium sp. Leaf350]|uniref:ATP-dependent helicase n=1 Tax=Aeromicrobium sp. Leaf350 TaxID=2876565 RepID=UPI001E62234E|nr:ATP-dependent helicase [Aeromicrobium sp. Leaf350]
MSDPLARFAPATRAWFRESLGEPTAAQEAAWTAPDDRHLLVVAPTGSGKTLAAFLSAIDQLLHREPRPKDAPPRGTSVLYVSPLKALAVDVERNLRSPLVGISRTAAREGETVVDVSVGIRSGDTPQQERRRLATHPPDVLITTPESLFLVLTSAARESLRDVHTVIVDEVHAVAGTKRGAHLALSLERLDALLERPARRVGLSATVRPADEVARFLGGGRPVETVAPPSPRHLSLDVRVPVDDLTDIPAIDEDSPSGTIWPHVERQVLDLVLAHRSTLVFVNSRGLAERLTSRLNEAWADRQGNARDPGADSRAPAQVSGGSNQSKGVADATLDLVARAHHGSVSKEQRALIEDDLKTGRLPCVVATSSLELGIDMGAVDLVVQVGSPPTVASGLQRVGRAGHQVGALSEGVVFPTSRTDLLSAAVTAERMMAGAIEALRVPANPLDVLAQQTVATCALEPIDVEDWFTTVRRSAPFASLPRRVYEAVLDLVSGRYPSEDFAELRPRVVWDRDAGTLTGRPGAQRLAVTNGGTIPDRGMFSVVLPVDEESTASRPAPRRVGELDEEMVYETRIQDVISLGATSWRVQEITHDRVIVVPAPGLPARLPFWRGDAAGRSPELGEAIGAAVRERAAGGSGGSRAADDSPLLDDRAAANLDAFLAEQRAATGVVPTDRTLVVESFRDELGDWRVVLHSPYGRRVHAPWALAVAARIRERYDLDGAVVASDDGIVARLPDLDGDAAPALAELFAFDPDELERIVTAEVGGSALFAARFRECAARALLLPRRNPGSRAPLWQQRQRGSQLLEVARRHPEFPILLETARECLQDVYDLPSLTRLMRGVDDRSVALVEVTTEKASPFAQNLVFGYVAAFLYEGDAPLAERRAAALSLDSGLLAELLGRAELRDLLDPEVVREVEAELQRTATDFRAKNPEQVADLVRRLGPIPADEVQERSTEPSEAPAWLAELQESRRLIEVNVGGRAMWAVIEDAGRLRDALGVALPLGVPAAHLEPPADALGDLVSRHARTHGPFSATALAARWGLGVGPVRDVLKRLTADGRLVEGEFRTDADDAAGPDRTEWVDAEILRRLRRRSLAAARRQVEPVDATTLVRFLPGWHGLDRGRRGETGLLDTIDQLAGVALPASAWESVVLPARVTDYSPAMLDTLLAEGEVAWMGAGTLGRTDGWLRLLPADLTGLHDPLELDLSDLHTAVLERLRAGGAFRFTDLTAQLDDPEIQAADVLWDLAWAGLVSNDSFAPVRSRSGSRGSTRARPTGRPRRLNARALRPASPPALAGRWFALPDDPVDPTRRAVTRAELLVARHGVLTRGAVMAEQVPGGFADVYRVLRESEDRGAVLRGMFVEGLGAAQFAATSTIDVLRSHVRESDDESGGPAYALASTDPAQPFGAALAWPETLAAADSTHRPSRRAGSLVLLHDGALVAYVERGARRILTFTDDPAHLTAAAAALADLGRTGRVGRLRVETVDDRTVGGTALGEAMSAAGFKAHPKGLQLR